MEERQRQIREGAGLEESRLNVEFIDFLRKFSTPILVIIALIAGGYAGWNYLQKQRDAARDRAFVELDSAVASRSVASLAAVADENAGRGAVALLAKLNEADLHLEAHRAGVRPGIQLVHDPVKNEYTLPEGEKYLTEEVRSAELDKAAALYTFVADETARDGSRVLLAIGGLHGLASVAESRAEFDKARTHYLKVVELARSAGFDALVAAASKRIESLEQLKTTPRLYALADLPKVQGAGPDPSGIISATTPEGTKIQVAPDPANPLLLTPIQIDPVTGEPKRDGAPTPLPAPEGTQPRPAPQSAPGSETPKP